MEQQTQPNTRGPLGLQQKDEFLSIMDSLFPDQELLNPNGKYRKRADLAFELMVKKGWRIREFQKTMSEFALKWTYFSWMPANLFEFKERYFPEDKMVM
jgi:hypothetical protein